MVNLLKTYEIRLILEKIHEVFRRKSWFFVKMANGGKIAAETASFDFSS